MYWNPDGSFSRLSTRLSVLKLDISLSTLFDIKSALILSISTVGDILESRESKFKVILNDLSPGKTVIESLLDSLTLDAINLGEVI